jgi:predicted amidohydrolase
MRVALAQIDSILGDTEENLRRAKEVVAQAKDRGADLTVFPELSLSGYALEELGDDVAIEAHSEPIISLAEAAGEMVLDTRGYWRGITRFYSRMLECYVVFVNRVGKQDSLVFWGYSHVVDPWGTVVAEAPVYEEALITVDIDLGNVRRRRREVPLVKEARLALLARELNRLVDEGGDL